MVSYLDPRFVVVMILSIAVLSFTRQHVQGWNPATISRTRLRGIMISRPSSVLKWKLSAMKTGMESAKGDEYSSLVLRNPKTATIGVYLVNKKILLPYGNVWSDNDNREFTVPFVDDLIARGLAYKVDEEGLRSLLESERLKSVNRQLPLRRTLSSVNMYVNLGTKENPLYQRMSGNFGDAVDDRRIYSNISQLFRDEEIARRSDDIALRIKSDFDFGSPEWVRWTKVSERHNTTTLTQVMAEYFSGTANGDLGDDDIDFVPQKGYVGTLPPGEKFPQEHPIESLPRRILHPWPAFQEIPFQVRWPVHHPYPPAPVLWLARNNLMLASSEFNNNSTEQNIEFMREAAEARVNAAEYPHAKKLRSILLELAGPDCPERNVDLAGGAELTESDCLYIAKHCKFGSSYDIEEQLPHPGFKFSGGYDLPNYFPDHPATLPQEVAEAPLPEDLKHVRDLLNTWGAEDRTEDENRVAVEENEKDRTAARGLFSRRNSSLEDEEVALRRKAVEAMMAEAGGGGLMQWQIEEQKFADYVRTEAIRRIKEAKLDKIECERSQLRTIPVDEYDDVDDFEEIHMVSEHAVEVHGGSTALIEEDEAEADNLYVNSTSVKPLALNEMPHVSPQASDTDAIRAMIAVFDDINTTELVAMERHVRQEMTLLVGHQITEVEETEYELMSFRQHLAQTARQRSGILNMTSRFKRGKRAKAQNLDEDELAADETATGDTPAPAVAPLVSEESESAAVDGSMRYGREGLSSSIIAGGAHDDIDGGSDDDETGSSDDFE